MYEMVYALKRYTFLHKLHSRRYKAMLPKHMYINTRASTTLWQSDRKSCFRKQASAMPDNMTATQPDQKPAELSCSKLSCCECVNMHFFSRLDTLGHHHRVPCDGVCLIEVFDTAVEWLLVGLFGLQHPFRKCLQHTTVIARNVLTSTKVHSRLLQITSQVIKLY